MMTKRKFFLILQRYEAICQKCF